MAEKLQMPAVTESSVAKKEAEKIAKQVKSLVIKNDEDLQAAITTLGQVKTTLAGIKKKKDSIIQPLNISIKEIREFFAAPESMLNEAETSLKRSIMNYQQEVERKAQAKAAKIEKKVEAGTMTLSQGINKVSKIERVDTQVKTVSGAGVQFKKLRKVRIVNVAIIPAAYFMDERVIDALRMAVSKDALATGEIGMVIPGVEVYEEQTVAGV